MTSTINLHTIFCHLVGDEKFLSTVIQTDTKAIEQKKNKQKGCNLMANMVAEYVPLEPYEEQNYAMFPHKMKSYLTPNHVRVGVKNTIERNMSVVNISFLNSLNMLIRPDLYKSSSSYDDHFKNLGLLEDYICHTIQRNYQIDKTKRTKKVQLANKELIKNLKEGKIFHELIQYIVNIFEINLIVFDLTKMKILMYWTKGIKYPYFNPFKNIYSMAYVQGNYEPILTKNNSISEEQKRKIYIQILTDNSEIKCIPDLKLGIHTLLYLNTWDIDHNSFNKIIETYLSNPFTSFTRGYDALKEIEN